MILIHYSPTRTHSHSDSIYIIDRRVGEGGNGGGEGRAYIELINMYKQRDERWVSGPVHVQRDANSNSVRCSGAYTPQI